MPVASASRSWFLLVLGTATALLYFAIGDAYLHVGQPHEDAYILFRYVNHAAAGLGIVFNSEGPRAEGATDFLWLAGLAGARVLGVDPALGALLANAVAAGGAAAALGWLLVRHAWSPQRAVAACATAPSVVLFHGAVAGYLGFSAMFYSALCTVPLLLGLAGGTRSLLLVPAAALLVALVRPDGAILCVGFVLVGCVAAWRRGLLPRYLAVSLAAGGVGLGYFIARFLYFGLLLPLPLYVKSRPVERDLGLAGMLPPGLYESRWWAIEVLPIAVSFAALVCVWQAGRIARLRFLAWFLPFALLAAALAGAHLSQNIHFRFQAPLTLAAWIGVAALAGDALGSPQRWRRGVAGAALLVTTLAIAVPGLRDVRALLTRGDPNYVDLYAPLLGRELREHDRLVVTEAGRLPYWSRAQFTDAVGLNSPHVALAPLRGAELDALRPDVVMFHHVGTLDPTRLGPPGGRLARLEPDALSAAVAERFQPLHETPPDRYADVEQPTTALAALALGRWLSRQDDYDVYAVDYRRDGRWLHLYGFRRDWETREAAVELLRRALESDATPGYWDVARP